MSRARDTATVYVLSPSMNQAVDRLGWAWGIERRPEWAIDQALPDTPDAAQHHIWAVRDEQDRLSKLIPHDPSVEIRRTQRDLDDLRLSWNQLHTGTGRWESTPAGHAARQLTAARHAHQQALHQLDQPDLTRREQRRALQDERDAARTLHAAEQRWAATGEPHAQWISRTAHSLDQRLDRLHDELERREQWLEHNAHIPDRIDQLGHQLEHAEDHRLTLEHQLRLDRAQLRHQLGLGHHPDDGRDLGHDTGLGL